MLRVLLKMESRFRSFIIRMLRVGVCARLAALQQCHVAAEREIGQQLQLRAAPSFSRIDIPRNRSKVNRKQKRSVTAKASGNQNEELHMWSESG